MICLASASPRRSILLDQLGLPHQVLPVQISEERRPGENPANYVRRLAQDKAEAARAQLEGKASLPIIGADTAVVVDDHVLGKPLGREDALQQLTMLSDRSHEVLSAVAVLAGVSAVRLSRSRVWFRKLTAAERAWYCATGEPLDKAGSYGIQGLGAIFITRLEGSFSGVMGLPLFETAELLLGAGVPLLAHARRGVGLGN